MYVHMTYSFTSILLIDKDFWISSNFFSSKTLLSTESAVLKNDSLIYCVRNVEIIYGGG